MRTALLVLPVCALLLACAASSSGEGGSGQTGLTATTLSTTTEAESSTDTDDGSTDGDGDGDTDGSTDTDTGTPGASLGVFDLTYYWVAYEGDHEAGNTIEIGTCEAAPIADVRSGFADALKLEGTGKLLDDRIVNVGGCGCGGGYDCFLELDPVEFPWGLGSQGNALMPFVSIATDPSVLAFGTWVYAPALDGQALPGGGTHDGCLLAADVGGAIDELHIDWFVGLRDNYLTLDPDVPETAELFQAGTKCP